MTPVDTHMKIRVVSLLVGVSRIIFRQPSHFFNECFTFYIFLFMGCRVFHHTDITSFDLLYDFRVQSWDVFEMMKQIVTSYSHLADVASLTTNNDSKEKRNEAQTTDRETNQKFIDNSEKG